MDNKILSESFMLSNGVRIPKLGLGTWMIDDDKSSGSRKACSGNRLSSFDTAQGYGNERGVGEGHPHLRTETGRGFRHDKLDAFIKDYDGTQAAIEGSLERLGLDYIDLMIIHAPQPWTAFREDDHYFEGNLAAWCAMEKAYKAGRLRAIGCKQFPAGRYRESVAERRCEADGEPDFGARQQHAFSAYRLLPQARHTRGSLFTDGTRRDDEESACAGYDKPVWRKHASFASGTACNSVCSLCPRPPIPNTWKRMRTWDFEISAQDMEILKNVERIRNYGEVSLFPVYGGKLDKAGNYTPRDFFKE